MGLESADGHHRLPKLRGGGVTLGAVGSPMIEKICGRRTGVESEAIKWIRWDVAQRFVLDDEIPQAIKNRLVAIELDAHENMRAVGDKYIRPLVDTAVRELANEVGLNSNVRALLCGQPASADQVLIVETHDHPIGLAPRFANLAQIFIDICCIASRADIELFAKLITVAAIFIVGFGGGAYLRIRMKAMVCHSLALAVKTKRETKPFERRKGFFIDHKGDFKSERVNPGLAGKIGPLVGGAVLL